MNGHVDTQREAKGKRTNGSRRKKQKRRANRLRWASEGVKIGCINVAGLTYFKVFLLLEIYNFDVLCFQETWLKSEISPNLQIPGYTLLEQRRENGSYGGIAILIRNSLKILDTFGNEYAQRVHVSLPDGSKAVINNVYLPPAQSLTHRGIKEEDARAAVHSIVAASPAANYVLTCGDFNTRVGTKAPCVGELKLGRASQDPRVCPRAAWLIQLCELVDSHILNGSAPREAARFTSCNKNKQGSASVDFILSQDPSLPLYYDADTLEGQSDHTLLHTSLPVAVRPPSHPAATTTSTATTTYRWDVGASIKDQIEGISKWKAHTDTEGFQQGMAAITEDKQLSNEDRTAQMEAYLLKEGQVAGVVTECKVQPPLNPNRWGKHLAPWFDGACRDKKKQYRESCREAGKKSQVAREALKQFTKQCRRAKYDFARKMPEVLKYKPAEFWKYIKKKQQKSSSNVDLRQFAAFNARLFCDPEAKDYSFHPVPDPATSAVTAEELQKVL